MIKFPENINSVVVNGCIFSDLKNQRNICYTINKNESTETSIYAKLPQHYRPRKSEKIVYESSCFVNGFKVVQTANGEYAYVRESDNLLLPYRYDIAFDFNEFGFAMVGKDGSVSWIDKDFKYFNLKGKMVAENLRRSFEKFDGWQGVSNFSKGNIPLSRVHDARDVFSRIVYFDTNGNLKKFYKYDGLVNIDFYRANFSEGTIFNEEGYAKSDEGLLFSKGYYISYKDLVKIATEKGFIDSISRDADGCFDKEVGKVLKKELK